MLPISNYRPGRDLEGESADCIRKPPLFILNSRSLASDVGVNAFGGVFLLNQQPLTRQGGMGRLDSEEISPCSNKIMDFQEHP